LVRLVQVAPHDESDQGQQCANPKRDAPTPRHRLEAAAHVGEAKLIFVERRGGGSHASSYSGRIGRSGDRADRDPTAMAENERASPPFDREPGAAGPSTPHPAVADCRGLDVAALARAEDIGPKILASSMCL